MSDQDTETLPFGCVLRQYRITETLSVGAESISYSAHDTLLERNVEIREFFIPGWVRREGVEVVLRNPQRTAEWRYAASEFMGRMEIPARCHHPNIFRVYDTFAENGTVYVVARHEKSEDMETWLQNLGRAPTEQELLKILLPLLSALESVHELGLLHREINPSNILLSERGPTLVGFGVASQQDFLTSQHGKAGGYAPFELYLRTGSQGPWTDLYALGAVMYRAITGRRPASAPDRAVSVKQGSVDPCESLAANLQGKYARELLTSVDAALQLSAKDRPQSARVWRDSLGNGLKMANNEEGAFLSPPAQSSKRESLPPPQRPRRSRFLSKLILASLIAMPVIGVGGLSLSWCLFAPQTGTAKERVDAYFGQMATVYVKLSGIIDTEIRKLRHAGASPLPSPTPLPAHDPFTKKTSPAPKPTSSPVGSDRIHPKAPHAKSEVFVASTFDAARVLNLWVNSLRSPNSTRSAGSYRSETR